MSSKLWVKKSKSMWSHEDGRTIIRYRMTPKKYSFLLYMTPKIEMADYRTYDTVKEAKSAGYFVPAALIK